MLPNPIMYCDGYKLDHRRQYNPGITRVLSNWTARHSIFPEQTHVISLGHQYFLKRFVMEEFTRGFFDRPVDEVCARYQRRIDGYLGPNEIGTDHIRALHHIGFLPLQFNALPEGTLVPIRVPMLTVENTHPDFFWLVNYIESLMSSVLWLPTTSATTARDFRKIFDDAAELTGSPVAFVDWQGHDFSFRGMVLPEGAALSAMGHLLFFTGTDTLPALDLIEDYYGPVPEGYLIGGSVAATEHSVMCAGEELGEAATFERLLNLYPTGIVSIVSDTWDLWRVLTTIIPALKEKILARDGKIVVRPDSGNPADIICGDPNAPIDSPAFKGVIELLWDTFGGTHTDTGYRMLNSHIGCIYGDAINKARAREIVERLTQKGFASGNMVFGVGSFTYQFVTRDNHGHAMKATWVEIDGKGRNIFKSPVTDNGEKFSAKGRLAVIHDEDGELILLNEATPEHEQMSLLRPVWRDGNFYPGAEETFDVIRARAQSSL